MNAAEGAGCAELVDGRSTKLETPGDLGWGQEVLGEEQKIPHHRRTTIFNFWLGTAWMGWTPPRATPNPFAAIPLHPPLC